MRGGDSRRGFATTGARGATASKGAAPDSASPATTRRAARRACRRDPTARQRGGRRHHIGVCRYAAVAICRRGHAHAARHGRGRPAAAAVRLGGGRPQRQWWA